MTEDDPIYLGEARLVRWAHTDSAGRTITLELPNHDARHPFEGIPTGKDGGQLMKICCVAIDEREQPVPADRVRRGRKGKSPGSSNGRTPDFDSGNGGSSPSPGTKSYTRIAIMKCKDPAFQYWIGVHPQVDAADREAHAIGHLKRKLGIASRSELGAPGEKQEAFKRLLTDFDVREMAR